MKKRNMLKAIRILRSALQRKDDQIDRLEAEIAEYREIMRSINDTINDIPYYERGPDLIDDYTLETDVNESFQWFRQWLKREGLDQPDGRVNNPAQRPLSSDGGFLIETPQEEYQRERREAGLMLDKPRLDGHFDGEGYHPDEDR